MYDIHKHDLNDIAARNPDESVIVFEVIFFVWLSSDSGILTSLSSID